MSIPMLCSGCIWRPARQGTRRGPENPGRAGTSYLAPSPAATLARSAGVSDGSEPPIPEEEGQSFILPSIPPREPRLETGGLTRATQARVALVVSGDHVL